MIFASAVDNWAFDVRTFAAIYSKKLGFSEPVLRKTLWGDYYVKTVKEVQAGTWKPTSVWGGYAEGMIRLAPLNDAIPASPRQQTLQGPTLPLQPMDRPRLLPRLVHRQH